MAHPLLGDRLLAIGSGKGGVGKSTTSANLAVLAAREGLRTGLIDLDPLSDLAVVFDVPRARLDAVRADLPADGSPARLEEFRLPLFNRLDLLFPHVKLRRGESDRLRHLLFERFAQDIADRYDVVFLDMPAGIGQEENLSFLPYIRHLVVVTNAEPTSHVSAGGFIKAAREINSDLKLHLWHNKFESAVNPEFDPRRLRENYNRYVSEDLQLDDAVAADMKDIAFVPHDTSLNLLLAENGFGAHLASKLREVLGLIDEQCVAELPEASEVPRPLRIIIRHYVIHHPGELALADVQAYLGLVLDRPGFRLPLDQELYLGKYLAAQARHPVRERIRRAAEAVDALAERMAGEGALAARRTTGGPSAELVRHRNHAAAEVGAVLDLLAAPFGAAPGARAPWPRHADPMVRNLGGMLMYYLCLLQLSAHASVQAVLTSFIPHRRLDDGRRVRDRHRQISLIITGDADYRARFFTLVKKLFPVAEKQIMAVAASRKWSALVFRESDGQVKRNAYLKLLAATLHDMVNGGLGIHVGIKHNAAAQAIQDGGRRLLGFVPSSRRR